MAAQLGMFILIAAVNVLTLVVMALTPMLQTIPNLYIAALAVTDLAVSFNQLLAVPWTWPPTHVYFEVYPGLCLFYKCLVFVNELNSLLLIGLIGVDRFLYIHCPFWYKRVVTKKAVTVAVLLVYLVSNTVAVACRVSPLPDRFPGCDLLALLYDTYLFSYLIGFVFFFICLTLFVSYGVVIRTAMRQARAIRASQFQVSMSFSASFSDNGELQRQLQKRLDDGFNLRIAKKMAGVFLVLVICWTPYSLVGLIGPEKVDTQIIVVSAFLAAFNSFANFGVYALADREFRAAMFRLFLRSEYRDSKVSESVGSFSARASSTSARASSTAF